MGGTHNQEREEGIMYKQVKDILKTVRAFHSDLSAYYITLKEEAGDMRTVMMLDYLARREEYIAEYIEKYIGSARDNGLKVWLKYVPWLPDNVFCHCREELEMKPPFYVDDVLDIAMHYDHCLVEYFSVLVSESGEGGSGSIFANLLNAAKKEEMKLANSTLWLNDI